MQFMQERRISSGVFPCVPVSKLFFVSGAFRNMISKPGCGREPAPEQNKRRKTAMNDPNEQKPNQSSSKTESTEKSFSADPASTGASPGAVPSKWTIDFARFFSWTMLKDFLDFKIMIIPLIVKYLYILVVVLSFFSSLVFCARLWHGFGLVLFPLAVVLNVFLLHIFFELLMLGFSVLDTMRQIRNEIMEQKGRNG